MSGWGDGETPICNVPVGGAGNASAGGNSVLAEDLRMGEVDAATTFSPAPAAPAQFVEFNWNDAAPAPKDATAAAKLVQFDCGAVAAAEHAPATTFAPASAAAPAWGSYIGAEAIPQPPAYAPAYQPPHPPTYESSYIPSYQPTPPPIHDSYGRVPINYGALDETPTSSTLFVGNLSSRADDALLRAAFGHHGIVTEVRLPTDKDTGMRKGFGYVAFAHPQDAQRAKNALSGVDVGGREVHLDYATSGSSAGPRLDKSGYGREPEPARNEPSHTLFVGGLPYDINVDTVREAFQAFGLINNVRLPTDKETGKPKGFGYVEFNSVDGAAAAFNAMNGAGLGGRSLRLDYAAPRPPLPDRAGDGSGEDGGRGPTNSESCTIFVAGVSYNATEDMIREVFQVHGTITGVRLPTDEDGKIKGFGYVEFDTVDEAIAAFEALNGTQVAGRNLRLDYAAERDHPPHEDEKQEIPDPEHEPSDTLFVGSLSRSANEDMVRGAFNLYGTITSCRLPTDKESGEMKGFAYVSFESQEQAGAAVAAMNGKKIDGRCIRLDYAEARPERERPPRYIEDPRNDQTDTLWVGGVSRVSTEDSYRAAFEPFGTVTRIYLPMDKDADPPHPKGYGYVGFSSVEEAQAAVAAMNGKEVDGRQIRIDYATPRPERGLRPDKDTNPSSCTLFVGSIDANSNENVIRKAFEVHGTITSIRIPIDESGNLKGIAYVEFDTVTEARAALVALNSTFRLDYAVERGNRSSGDDGNRESREPQEPTNEPTDTLFVGGISRSSTEDSIREAFAPFGEITRCYLVMDKESDPPQPKGFGYVAFSSTEEAIAAVIAMNGKQVDGRQVRLDYSEPRPPRDQPDREPDPPTIDPTDTLFVGGISKNSTEYSVRKAFAPFGKITRCYLVLDKESDPPQPKGFGYVAFSSVEEAIAACAAKNGKKLDGRQLRIDYSEPHPGRVPELREVVPPESPPNSSLFVAGVSRDSTEDSYRKAFSPYGNAIRVCLQRDPDTGDLKGIGWVSFSSVAEAEAAVEGLNGKEIDGRQIRLDYTEPRPDDPNKMSPKFDDQARHFDPNDIPGGVYHRLPTRVEPAINLLDRFELFLLQDGEKKIAEEIDTRTPNSSIFTILKEDHTLCNLLRAHLLKDPAVLFAGYKIPHPLFAKVELRVQTDGSITPKEAVVACSKKLVSDLGQFSREFTKEFELRKMVAGANGGVDGSQI